MLTLSDFVKKWDGKKMDFDYFPKNQPYQCVDVTKYWAANFGYPQLMGNAIDYQNRGDGKNYNYVKKNSANYPAPGDIFVMGAMPGNALGHTGVVLTANKTGFTSFDQNWPPNSAAHKQSHDYKYVIGWLVVKAYQTGGEDQMNFYDLANTVSVGFRGKPATVAEIKSLEKLCGGKANSTFLNWTQENWRNPIWIKRSDVNNTGGKVIKPSDIAQIILK